MGRSNETAVVVGRLAFTEEDARAGLLDLSGHLRWYRLPLLSSVLAVPMLTGLAWMHEWTGFASLFAVWVVLAFVMPFGQRRAARALARQMADGESEYRFESESVTIQTPGSRTTTQYRMSHSAREGKSAFLLFHQSQIANLVPKRAFRPEDLARVREMVAKIGPLRSKGRWLVLAWAALVMIFFALWFVLNPR